MKNNYTIIYNIKTQFPNKVFEKHVYSISKEIEQQFRNPPEIIIQVRDKELNNYSVSMSILGDGSRYFAKKNGRKGIPLIKKIRRTILKKVREDKKMKVTKNRKLYFKNYSAP